MLNEIEQKIVSEFPDYGAIRDELTEEEIVEFIKKFESMQRDYERADKLMDMQFNSKAGIDYSTDYDKAMQEAIEKVNIIKSKIEEKMKKEEPEITQEMEDDPDFQKYNFVVEALKETINKKGYKENLIPGFNKAVLVDGEYNYVTRDNNYRQTLRAIGKEEIDRIMMKIEKSESIDQASKLLSERIITEMKILDENSKQY